MQNSRKFFCSTAMPSVKVAELLISTPPISTGRRPNRAISSEAGSVVIMEVTNCSDSGSVASQAIGANNTPTSAVLMMLTFIVVMDSACAEASLMTVFLCDMVNMGRLGNGKSEAVVPGAGNHL